MNLPLDENMSSYETESAQMIKLIVWLNGWLIGAQVTL